jgi:hypothetical protein
MGVLDRFSPQQRQALMVGVPAVAGFVIVGKLFKSRTSASGGVATIATPSTDAIGVGQLSDFESHISDQVNTLATLIAGWEPASSPPPPPPPPPPPAPDHTQASPMQQPALVSAHLAPPPPLSADIVAAMQAGGESIVQVAESSAGGWLYLTSKGGVYNEGGSPFFGSYLGYAGSTDDPAREIALHGHFGSGGLVALPGGHYSLINASGEVYNF